MNNPYFQPGPDGRRPIVERVPECKYSGSGYYWHGPHLMRGGGGAGYNVGEAATLALCRCAVEDWLLERRAEGLSGKPMGRLCIQRDSFNALRRGGWEVDGHTAEADVHGYGETVHDALNAAAHAVADAIGVPH